jgi:hypothetical protein
MTGAHAYRVNYVQELDDDQIETPCGCNSVIAERPSLLPYPKSNNFIYSQPVPKRTLQICLLSAFAVLGAVDPRADACPPAKDEIATDRLDVTNSSLVVPVGSLQSENGVNFSARDGGRTINGTNTRWPLGVAPCLELLLDLPVLCKRPRAGKFGVFECCSSEEVAGQSDTGKDRLVPSVWG